MNLFSKFFNPISDEIITYCYKLPSGMYCHVMISPTFQMIDSLSNTHTFTLPNGFIYVSKYYNSGFTIIRDEEV